LGPRLDQGKERRAAYEQAGSNWEENLPTWPRKLKAMKPGAKSREKKNNGIRKKGVTKVCKEGEDRSWKTIPRRVGSSTKTGVIRE